MAIDEVATVWDTTDRHAEFKRGLPMNFKPLPRCERWRISRTLDVCQRFS